MPDPKRRVLVLTPLAHEERPLARALQDLPDVRVVRTGPGPAAVRRKLAELLHQDPAPHSLLVVLAGVAGALAPTPPGVPTVAAVVNGHGERHEAPFLPSSDTPSITLLGLDEPVYTPQEKRRWHEQSGAALVDTESHELVRICAEQGIAWAVVRGVSDRENEALPRQVGRWVSEAGATRPLRVLGDILFTPSLIPAVAQLARRSADALPRVVQIVRATATAWLRDGPTISAPHGPAITPLPIPDGTPLVLLVGGTFDPPHRAHVLIPAEARDALEHAYACPGRAWLVYIPAARSPHKAAGPAAADADRVAMLRLALADTPRAAVWTDELDRAASGGPSYTIDTISRARRWLDAHDGADTRLRMLIGADQALAFHRWREPREIIRLAEPAVVLRPPIGSTRELVDALRATGAWTEPELEEWGGRGGVDAKPGRTVVTRTIDAAATAVRAHLGAGEDPSSLEPLLEPRVIEYIRSRRLYAPGA